MVRPVTISRVVHAIPSLMVSLHSWLLVGVIVSVMVRPVTWPVYTVYIWLYLFRSMSLLFSMSSISLSMWALTLPGSPSPLHSLWALPNQISLSMWCRFLRIWDWIWCRVCISWMVSPGLGPSLPLLNWSNRPGVSLPCAARAAAMPARAGVMPGRIVEPRG